MGNTETEEKSRNEMNIFEKVLAVKEALGTIVKNARGYNFGHVSEDELQSRFSASAKYTRIKVDNPSEIMEDACFELAQMTGASRAFGAAETYACRCYIMKTFQTPTPEDEPRHIAGLRKKTETVSYGGESHHCDRAAFAKPSASAGDTIGEERRIVATEKLGETEGPKAIRRYAESRGTASSADFTKARYGELLGLIKSDPGSGDTPLPD